MTHLPFCCIVLVTLTNSGTGWEDVTTRKQLLGDSLGVRLPRGPFLCGHISSSIGVGKAFLFLQYWSRLLGIITPMQFFLACLCILFLLVAVYANWPSFVSWFSDKGCLPCLMWSSEGLEDFHSIVSQTVVIETRLSQDALHWEDSITLESCMLSSSP